MRSKRPLFKVRGVDPAELAARLREYEEKSQRIYLFVGDVAKHFKVHDNTVYAWLENGTIFPNATKTKHGWKIPLEDVQALKDSSRMKRLTREEVRPPRPMDKSDAAHSMPIKQYHISPCIYFLLNQEHEVLYVGQSVSVFGRIGSHIRTIPGIYSVRIHRCSHQKLNDLEQHFIVKYQPPYNAVTTRGERLAGEYTSYVEG